PGGGEPCGGSDGRRAVGRTWALRRVCRVQWKQAASASRGVGGGGDTGGRRTAGGGVSGDQVATGYPGNGVGEGAA
ncbi:MAG: hypothetical protein ACK56I_23160, partial [bacterium]